MPMYEFKCRKCGADFEELATPAEVEAGEVVCSECGSKQVDRQMSTFASGGDISTGSSLGGGCGSSGFG